MTGPGQRSGFSNCTLILRRNPANYSKASARALRWQHVDLDGDPAARPPVPPHVAVWRSVRAHGETKAEWSRRTLGLPQMAVKALRGLRDSQADERLAAGEGWQDTRLGAPCCDLAAGWPGAQIGQFGVRAVPPGPLVLRDGPGVEPRR